jgi:hypothetical protein
MIKIIREDNLIHSIKAFIIETLSLEVFINTNIIIDQLFRESSA